MQDELERHLASFVEFLTEQNIDFSSQSFEPAFLEKVNACCYAESYHASLAVIPKDQEQVSMIVRFLDTLADSKSLIHLYTISTGQNWGYGSGTPSSQNAVVMSLHKLNARPTWLSNKHDKDTPYGKKAGIVRLEPGVSQQQLYEFLIEEGGDFWMDATGSATSSSVLANTLERGFGHTSYGDHFDHCAGMEIVLADGTCFKTGHAGHENAANVGVHKHGHGPVLEGLFSQSNLGIVTAMYIQLLPAVKYINKFFIKLNSNEDFLEAVEVLRPLKMSGVLESQMHCANTHKGIQAIMRYPFNETDGETPLPEVLVKKYANQNDISAWTISGAVYADSKPLLGAKTQLLKKALKAVPHKLIILSPSLIQLGQKVTQSSVIKKLNLPLLSKLEKPFEILNELLGLKRGKPTNYFLNSVYYRMRELSVVKTGNPDADNVGLIWLAPIGPMTKETISLMIEGASKISLKYGFDPALSITLLNKKAADCVISLVYDRSCPNEDNAALSCYDEMLAYFNELGFSSYRSAIRAMQTNQLGFSPELEAVHSKLKACLDPKELIAKNHYIKG